MRVPLPPNEEARLEALRKYRILDTDDEEGFDDVTALASYICGTPIAFVSLVDRDRQWMKSRRGSDLRETSRDVAFCAYTILGPELLIVPDARKDERFSENPLVTQESKFHFYAGAPLETKDGHRVGALCVIDHAPRALNREQKVALRALSRQVMAQMDLRRVTQDLAEALENVHTLEGLLPICSYCKGGRDDAGYWQTVELFVSNHSAAKFSHSICPGCMEQHFPDA